MQWNEIIAAGHPDDPQCILLTTSCEGSHLGMPTQSIFHPGLHLQVYVQPYIESHMFRLCTAKFKPSLLCFHHTTPGQSCSHSSHIHKAHPVLRLITSLQSSCSRVLPILASGAVQRHALCCFIEAVICNPDGTPSNSRIASFRDAGCAARCMYAQHVCTSSHTTFLEEIKQSSTESARIARTTRFRLNIIPKASFTRTATFSCLKASKPPISRCPSWGCWLESFPASSYHTVSAHAVSLLAYGPHHMTKRRHS